MSNRHWRYTMKTIRRFARALLIVLLLTLTFCEVSLRAIAATSPLPELETDPNLIAARSNPANRWYKHSPYWSSDFVLSLAKSWKYYTLNEDDVLEYENSAVN